MVASKPSVKGAEPRWDQLSANQNAHMFELRPVQGSLAPKILDNIKCGSPLVSVWRISMEPLFDQCRFSWAG